MAILTRYKCRASRRRSRPVALPNERGKEHKKNTRRGGTSFFVLFVSLLCFLWFVPVPVGQARPVDDGTTVDVMNIKSASMISGLTPRTIYAFQVRAIGAANRSAWSSS